MTLKEQREAMDAILRDFWRKGGPQRPSYPNGGTRKTCGNDPFRRGHAPNPVLEAEQRRLMRTWNRKEGR